MDSETFFVGFRNFFRQIQKLYFDRIQKNFCRVQKTFFRGFTTPAERRCYTRSGPRVGWGGMITFFGLEHMVDVIQDLRLGSGGVGGDDNVLWPCTDGRCYTRSKAGVG